MNLSNASKTLLALPLIIINADDLGKSEGVNCSIFQLMEEHTISSSSILANGPAIDGVDKIIKLFKHCSFGVHLNLTEFEPLSSCTNGLRTIMNEEGAFSGLGCLRNLDPVFPRLARAIYKEWCAQINRLIASGINISHIDSHHHVHTMPQIFPVLKRIQKKYGIRKVRISRNIYLPGQNVSKILSIKKRVYNFVLTHYYKTSTTSGLCNLRQFYENLIAGKLHHKTIEVMIHPGADEWVDEERILKVIWHREFARRFTMINYWKL